MGTGKDQWTQRGDDLEENPWLACLRFGNSSCGMTEGKVDCFGGEVEQTRFDIAGFETKAPDVCI